MARPRKTGLDYFPFDCEFFSDERILVLAGEFGIKGEIVTVKLLCAIYHNGYFALWNEPLKFKLAHQCPGVSPELIDQIVNRLVKWDFFDKGLFDSAKVLSSVEIQERYFLAASKRVPRNFPYLLITPKTAPPRHPESQPPTLPNEDFGVSPAETPVSSAETRVSPAETHQSKENKIKEKRKNSLTRVKKNAAGGDVCLAPSIEEVENYFRSHGFISSASLFFNYYQGRGWKIRGSSLTDWKALACAWDAREKKGFNQQSSPAAPPGKSLSEELAASDRRKKKEAQERARREAIENPSGLTPAQSLADFRTRHNLPQDTSLASVLGSILTPDA